MRLVLRLLVISTLALGIAATRTAPVRAAGTYTVTNCSTDAQLQAAVVSADTSGGTIDFACSGDIVLGSSGTGTTLTISNAVVLDGSGQRVAIDGADQYRAFIVDTLATLTLKALTVERGAPNCQGSNCGVYGAIDNEGGTVNVTDSTLTNNSPTCVMSGVNPVCETFGGAIYNNLGTVSITNSTLSRNSPTCIGSDSDSICFMYGGAIDNEFNDMLTITDSTFSGNAPSCTVTGPSSNCDLYGAVIENYGSATIADSTLYGNSVFCTSSGVGSQCFDEGGAVDESAGQISITDSTLSGNSATCIASNSGSSCEAQGGAISGGFKVNVGGTIIANTTGGNCDIAITDWGNNLEDDAGDTCGFSSANHDLVGVDPDLVGLAYNGGPTATMALQPYSQAIDYIPTSAAHGLCPATGGTDQRGRPRPDNSESVCDIGAYEYQDGVGTQPPSGTTAYDIESANWYCTVGGSSCVSAGSDASYCVALTPCLGASYGAVEAFGPPNDSTNGIPDELILACVHGTSTGYQIGYLDVVSTQGNLEYPGGGVYGYADPGAISGKGTLIGGGGGEDNPSQPSSVSGSAYDPSTGILGSVTGTQNTDNSDNRLNAGQFGVTIRGKLWSVDLTGTSPVTTRNSSSSMISCTVGGPHAYDLLNAGKDVDVVAEGELENLLGDNTFLQIFAPKSP